jgi:hypothetical protein
MLPTLCNVLLLCVIATHVHPCWGGRKGRKAKRGDIEAETVRAESNARPEIGDEKGLVAMPAPTASTSRQHPSDDKAWVKGD